MKIRVQASMVAVAEEIAVFSRRFSAGVLASSIHFLRAAGKIALHHLMGLALFAARNATGYWE